MTLDAPPEKPAPIFLMKNPSAPNVYCGEKLEYLSDVE